MVFQAGEPRQARTVVIQQLQGRLCTSSVNTKRRRVRVRRAFTRHDNALDQGESSLAKPTTVAVLDDPGSALIVAWPRCARHSRRASLVHSRSRPFALLTLPPLLAAASFVRALATAASVAVLQLLPVLHARV